MSVEIMHHYPTPIERELYEAVYVVHDPDLQSSMTQQEERTIRMGAVLNLNDFSLMMSNSILRSVAYLPNDRELKSVADTVKKGMRCGYLIGKLGAHRG